LICLSCKFLNHGNKSHVEEARTEGQSSSMGGWGGGWRGQRKKVWNMNSSVDFLSFPLPAQFEE